MTISFRKLIQVFFVIILTSIAPFKNLLSAEHLNLKQCLSLALIRNPEMEIADYSIEGATEKKGEADKIGYPIFDYEYNLAPAPKDTTQALQSFGHGDITPFNRIKIGMGVPLNTFGKVKTGKALADVGVEAEKRKKDQKKAEIVLKVKQLYYGVLLAREVSHLLDSAHNGLDGEVKKREEKGGTDPGELLKLKLFRAEIEKRMAETERKAILAKEALAIQMGYSNPSQFEIIDEQFQPISTKLKSYEDYRRMALDQRPDLKLLDLGRDAKAKQVTLEKRLMTPNVGVGSFFELGRASGVSGVATTDDFNNPFNYTRAGVGLQLKGTLDVHNSRVKIKQANTELKRLMFRKTLHVKVSSSKLKMLFGSEKHQAGYGPS
ncbi:MAG: TolC family protein [Deltaproteobacteria bacterium]|nr:MAG: TolC family protein [Deltaproteobacteria bacterium]